MEPTREMTLEEYRKLDEAANLTSSERYEVCKGCDRNFMGACRECGCIVSLKVLWKSQSCPIGKWGPSTS